MKKSGDRSAHQFGTVKLMVTEGVGLTRKYFLEQVESEERFGCKRAERVGLWRKKYGL